MTLSHAHGKDDDRVKRISSLVFDFGNIITLPQREASVVAMAARDICLVPYGSTATPRRDLAPPTVVKGEGDQGRNSGVQCLVVEVELGAV
jgi:hypothetical protein